MKSIILSLLFCCTVCVAFAQTKTADSSATARPDIVDVSNKLKVYPNPSSNWLFVTHPAVSKKGVQLLIADLNGKTILKAEVKTEAVQSILNISSLTSGTYVLLWNNGIERGTAMIRKN